jgi:hypothetical protein
MRRIGTQDKHSPATTLLDTLDRAITARSWAPTLRIVLVACALGLPPLGALALIVWTLGPYLAAIVGAIVGAVAGAGLLGATRRRRRSSRAPAQ